MKYALIGVALVLSAISLAACTTASAVIGTLWVAGALFN